MPGTVPDALPPLPPDTVVSGPLSKWTSPTTSCVPTSSCERSSLVMPAGLPNTVAASWALAARPADAVPRSGVPISYTQNPAAVAGAADSITLPVSTRAAPALRPRVGG
jgi:hypothetical protein